MNSTFQGTIFRDGTLEKAGTSSGVDALLFASPAPEMVAEIGPCISRNHLQRWNLEKGRNQLWS